MMKDEMLLDKITTQALRLPPLQKVQLVERLMVILQQDLVEPPSKPLVPTEQESLPPITEATFKQKLLAAGLLTEIKSPPRRSARRPAPLRVSGKPLSAIVIEDRR
jgi:hypothetical protein